MLNDPGRRQEFTATLDAIARSLPAASAPSPAPSARKPPGEAAPAPPGAAVPTELTLAPNSLGAALVVGASSFLSRIGDEAEGLLRAIRAVPPPRRWLEAMLADPLGQALLLDTAWRLAAAIGAGLIAERIIFLVLRKSIARVLSRRTPPPSLAGDAPTPSRTVRRRQRLEPLRRLPRAVLHLLFDLLPVLGFVVTAHLVAASQIAAVYLTRLVLLAGIDAYVASRVAIAVAGSVLSPADASRRLVPFDDPTAAAVLTWTRWIVLIGIVGYALAEIGLLLGMSAATHDAMLKVDVGLVYLMLIAIILRYRRPVAAFIRARPASPDEAAVESGRRSRIAYRVTHRLRRWLSRIWHVAASIYLIALWLVWVVDIPSGFSRLVHDFVLTIAVLLVAQLFSAVLQGMLDRAVDPQTPVNRRNPGRAERLRVYYPVLAQLLRILLGIAVCLELGEVYGLGIADWLTGTPLGRRVMSAAATITVTLVLAVVIWESANDAVRRHLGKLEKDAQLARSARLRTLLPMLRTALLVSILVIVAMMVLSEIGVNIAPLLAGAGVLGIAIGFGSQKLVQDIITGLFLLLENTMQVGDVVTLGGLSGVVEQLSIRTIRLRAEDGSVYVIPFSAVTTVTNMTRDFSQAVIEAQVAYKDDYDDVVAVLRGIAADMRAEPQWATEIRDDIEVMGLERFADNAVVIKCRIRCGPFGRWSVGREFRRRMKLAFDAEGIEIPSPSQKLIFEPLAPGAPFRAGSAAL